MVMRSPVPDISIPDVPLTSFVLRHARRLADKPALIDGTTGRTLTYSQLAQAIRQTAGGLASRGFGKGDVLALCSPNLPEYAVAFHAVALLGGTVTTINPVSTVQEIAEQLGDSVATRLVTTPDLLDKAREAARGTAVQEFFVFGTADGATAFSDLIDAAATPPDVAIDPARDVVALPYSSGTTGFPKGVMLTHRNLVANLLQADAMRHIKETDTLIGVLPLFHIYGLVVILNGGLYAGATTVLLPRFDLELVLKTLQDRRVTLAHFVPPVVLALAKQPVVDHYDLSALRAVFSGAAPLGAELSEACSNRLHCRIQQGYGMTEASPVTHMSPPPPAPLKLGSVGVLVPNTECRILDPLTGKDLAAEQAGELWIRGPQVMQGYLRRPEATRQTIDAEGWLHTGDIGLADQDGHFRIVDRVKELIKYKGLQVAPAELEAVLLTHAQVADAAVIPVPDEEAGEVPKAFVVLRAPVPAQELLAFVAERVAPFKKVRRIEVLDAIPKSPSGKILRRVLVQREKAAISGGG